MKKSRPVAVEQFGRLTEAFTELRIALEEFLKRLDQAKKGGES